VQLILGDCLEVMRELPDESVDAVVTDPPAGISLMGREWDHHKGGRDAWVAWMTEVMRECYRLLKPGGHVVCWALPRTSHWTGWAIEGAGFEMRDKVIHGFASGFPKSLNLPGGLGTALKPAYEDWWLARKPLRGTVAQNVLEYGTGALNIDATRIPGTEAQEYTVKRLKPGATLNKTGGNWRPDEGVEYHGETKAGRWPPNLLLSDPIFDGGVDGVVGAAIESSADRGSLAGNESGEGASEARGVFGPALSQPTYSRFFLIPKSSRSDREPVLRGQLDERGTKPYGGAPLNNPAYEYSDGAHRDHQRRPPRQNTHPTTKPTELMRHLVRLVTPPGGTVLDPFLGSGTTAIACEMEGFAWIGIEKEAEYVEIAKARLNGVQRGLGLDVQAPTRKPPKTHPDLSKHQPKHRAPAENYSGGWAGTPEEAA